MSQSITLVLPPLTQLNTPYPSISYLAAHLRAQGIACSQRDFGIELVLRMFSREGLAGIFDEIEQLDELPEPAWRVLALREQHLRVIDPVISFLQGRDGSLASRILDTPFLPSGPRLEAADLQAFGAMGAHDAARHLATLYLEDLADLVTACIDPGFGLARYQAHLASGEIGFDPLWERLAATTLVDQHLDALCDSITSDVVALSVPFPGNLYGALRLGRQLRARGVRVILGGGYINTELREIHEPRLWECVDAVTYDDGEGPLEALLQHYDGQGDRRHRTRTAEGYHDVKVARPPIGCAADYGDLELGHYLQLIDTLNPAHRLWSDGRWNKITVAHGCYWKRCAFCDVSLDYISHYQEAEVGVLVDHMERLVKETGQTGFHFVDEAAPPKALKALALEILRRNLAVTLWGNIRFEQAFTPDLCRLLAAAGVVAVTGGLEVANERVLGLMDKGVTVPQVARASAAFREAGIMVHAYLMYGFPSQTEQETIDSMELVRQLFSADLINSAFWHRFVLTRHAPIFSAPTRFGITVEETPGKVFARNDIAHQDPRGGDHDRFDEVLPLALDAWMQGHDLDLPVHEWFEQPMPATTQAADRIERTLDRREDFAGRRLIWLGGEAIRNEDGLTLHSADDQLMLQGDRKELDWVCNVIDGSRPGGRELGLAAIQKSFPGRWKDFEPTWQAICQLGLVIV